jgi:mRNA interferase MazF
MGRFVRGDVVVVSFPFSDLSSSKRRPALVVAQLTGDDVVLCQITTPARADGYSIPLSRADFDSGGLNHDSHIPGPIDYSQQIQAS